MPLIRIDVPEGPAREKKEIIHKRVREVVLKTLAPKQVQYDYVSIREAFGIIGDGLPVIDVDLRPGREPERKKGLVDGIAEVLNENVILCFSVHITFCPLCDIKFSFLKASNITTLNIITLRL